VANFATLPTRIGQSVELAMLHICDGAITAGSTRSAIFLIGHVLSRTAVNKVTLAVQKQLDTRRLATLEKTPKMLIVDGVWADIQYTREEFKEDRSGHLRAMS
jgi:hypothetical protein